jgi:farnesyl-diphosphate farnesyltransferase
MLNLWGTVLLVGMNDGERRLEPEADLDWCHEAVQEVSRTFAITIDQLEGEAADAICVGYLLCRVADTIEDAGHVPPEEQSELLRTYERTLDPEGDADVDEFVAAVDTWIPAEPDADWRVVGQTPRILATFLALPDETRSALLDPVLELVDGMAEFVDRYAVAGGLRIESVEELEEYCWYAAGTVGALITNLLARDADPEATATMRDTAESFALLLQLVNVAKDVGDDYREENNVYLPAAWLAEESVDQEALLDPDNADAVARVVERLTRRAEGYVDDAVRYLQAMPEARGNRLAAWAIPCLLAVGTIRELLDRPREVLEGDVKVSRGEVYAVVERFERGVDREQLPELRRRIAEAPFDAQS